MLPPGWQGYAFTLCYRGCRFHCRVEAAGASLTWLEGADARVRLNGDWMELTGGDAGTGR